MSAKHSLEMAKRMAKVLLMASLGVAMCIPSSVSARIYKYKDDQGKVHFTDDPSSIPLKYRRDDTLKRMRGVTPALDAASQPQASGANGEDSQKSEDEGLSAKDKALVEKTIQVLQGGVALGEQFKDAQPNSSNGRGATMAIQANLPKKESLLAELKDTKVEALKPVASFLTKSIAADKTTGGIGVGLKTRIFAILDRIRTEGKQQASLIKQLEKALSESQNKKKAAQQK